MAIFIDLNKVGPSNESNCRNIMDWLKSLYARINLPAEVEQGVDWEELAICLDNMFGWYGGILKKKITITLDPITWLKCSINPPSIGITDNQKKENIQTLESVSKSKFALASHRNPVTQTNMDDLSEIMDDFQILNVAPDTLEENKPQPERPLQNSDHDLFQEDYGEELQDFSHKQTSTSHLDRLQQNTYPNEEDYLDDTQPSQHEPLIQATIHQSQDQPHNNSAQVDNLAMVTEQQQQESENVLLHVGKAFIKVLSTPKAKDYAPHDQL